MKRILSIVLCAALSLTLFGCGTGEEAYTPTGDGLTWEEEDQNTATQETEATLEQELMLVYYPDIPLNPYTCTDFTNRTLLSLIYQSLFVVDSNYNVFPMLCGSYTVSNDMRTYNVYIDRSATFSDGTPLTVEDVFASYQAAKLSRIYKGRFLHVVSITKNESGGITFQLDTAYENFPLLLDVPIVKASEVEAPYPLGTGPYALENTASGARLRRRKNWWCDPEMTVTASAIPLQEAESLNQIRDAFEFGNVGLVCTDPGSDKYAHYRCDYELWDSENGVFLYIGCNTASKVFSTAKVRSALTYAIDREYIVQEYYRNFAHSTTLPVSPLSPYYNAKLASQYAYDPERFAKVISESFLADAPVRLLVNEGDTLRLQIAREIGRMLTDCGLMVEMVECSGNDYNYYLGTGDFDLYVSQTRLSANMDLSAFFKPEGALRYGGMSDAAIYSLCLEALANKGNYVNLYRMVAEDGRLCPVLFQSYNVHATRGLLTGLTPSRDNVFFYTLDKTMDDVLR